MFTIVEFKKVIEGGVELKIPVVERILKKNAVFYNPVMEFNRDISVAVARVLSPASFCDGLAGSGARGLRVAKEACVPSVTLNDLNGVACGLMRENAELNGLRVEVVNDDLNHLLCGRKFDFVDIDPFGPPVRYLDAALHAMGKRGWLGVAATDTRPLCGGSPAACMRKYDALPLRTDYYNEVGLRILLGFVARAAVRYDRGVRFLFSHCTRHYFRVFSELDRGRAGVKETQEKIIFLQHCFRCLRRDYRRMDELDRVCACGAPLSTSGPLWGGAFADKEFSKKLGGELLSLNFKKSAEESKLVEVVAGEQDFLTPYYDLHKLCKSLGGEVPKRDDFFGALLARGFGAAKTHFSPIGFRSDAPLDVIVGVLHGL